MSNYLHGLIAVAYLVLAAIVGFGLYQSGATVEPSVAAAVSVAVMLAAGLVHQAITRPRRERMLVATLDGVQESQAKIEQEEQLVELLEFGIDFGQGYLFGAPRPSRQD